MGIDLGGIRDWLKQLVEGFDIRRICSTNNRRCGFDTIDLLRDLSRGFYNALPTRSKYIRVLYVTDGTKIAEDYYLLCSSEIGIVINWHVTLRSPTDTRNTLVLRISFAPAIDMFLWSIDSKPSPAFPTASTVVAYDSLTSKGGLKVEPCFIFRVLHG